jgi:hypothetical protein
MQLPQLHILRNAPYSRQPCRWQFTCKSLAASCWLLLLLAELHPLLMLVLMLDTQPLERLPPPLPLLLLLCPPHWPWLHAA